jgi:uncharacterized protein
MVGPLPEGGTRLVGPRAETSRSGAVAPAAAVAVAPLGGRMVRITGGLLGAWQRRNREATIPHVIGQLSEAGNVENLRRLLVENPAPYRGRYPFLDTDLYKTLEGLAYELAADEAANEAIRGFYEEVIALLAAVQADDGYLNSRFQDPDSDKRPWSDLAWGHEMYNLGHLIQAAVAAHRQLADDRLLTIATRFADLVVARFGAVGEDAVCGHPEVEMALIELYRVTGKKAYLNQAQLFIDRRGRRTVRHRLFPPEYLQDHVPFREMPAVTGHAVRMMYLAAGAADVWLETGDETLAAALRRLWDDMVARKLYITGGLGSRHSDEAIGDGYELPGERAYAETCAAIGTMQWAWRMFAGTGEAKYLDVMETVLYNAFAVGISASGTAFFYDNPLQRRPDHDQRSGAEIGGEPLRRAWFGCPCCPPNVVRWMSQLGDYLAAESADALYIANYADAAITGSRIAVSVTTDYPWDGDIRIRVDAAPPDGEPYGIKLRVPGWAKGASLAGISGTAEPGWLTITRRWRAGDEFTLTLPMPVRAHGSHPYLDATRGALAIARGPLIYAAEQADCEADIDDLVLDAQDAARALVTPGPALPDSLVIHATARRVPPPASELYPELPEDDPVRGQPRQVTLIPYFLWGNREPGPMRVWMRRS